MNRRSFLRFLGGAGATVALSTAKAHIKSVAAQTDVPVNG